MADGKLVIIHCYQTYVQHLEEIGFTRHTYINSEFIDWKTTMETIKQAFVFKKTKIMLFIIHLWLFVFFILTYVTFYHTRVLDEIIIEFLGWNHVNYHQFLISIYFYRCEGSVTDINVESGIGKWSSNFGLICCIHFHTNILEECMNTSLL